MTWKQVVLQLVTQLCDKHGSRSFSLTEFSTFSAPVLVKLFPANNNREAKIRQTLQFLRDDGLIAFKDGRGNYTLLGETILVSEVEPEAVPILRAFKGEPQKREYLIEIYARNKGLVKTARELFDFRCTCLGCSNSFLKADSKTPYCEVHHITPFCEGGEDILENLSVLCAHHHRMAHFAVKRERLQMQKFLLQRTSEVLAISGQ
ncbi:hypothetical protein IAD21_01155 [Abditibacteriota bacterium]|nr:hypothetical protein IAD21_01155 [Abditibacteriota bacterium]